jgi:hypothetical protein
MPLGIASKVLIGFKKNHPLKGWMIITLEEIICQVSPYSGQYK